MFRIRDATPGDAGDLQRLFAEVVSTAPWLPPEGRARTDFAAASEGERIVIAVDEADTPVGLVGVWEPERFVHHLYVARAWRGRGVGTALLASLDAWLPRPWRLKCNARNADALAFYRARGWTAVGTGDGDDGPYHLLESPAGEPTRAVAGGG